LTNVVLLHSGAINHKSVRLIWILDYTGLLLCKNNFGFIGDERTIKLQAGFQEERKRELLAVPLKKKLEKNRKTRFAAPFK